MSRVLQRIPPRLAIIGMIAFAAALVAFTTGARINTTRSIGVGVYWTSHAPMKTGAYVLFCPPQTDVFDHAKARGYIGAGFCPGGYGDMMKRILATANDILTVNDHGVWVNGTRLPNSRPIQADTTGQTLPYFRVDNYTLGNDELLLMSDISPTSFDARYFGPIHRAQVKTVIRPVLTW